MSKKKLVFNKKSGAEKRLERFEELFNIGTSNLLAKYGDMETVSGPLGSISLKDKDGTVYNPGYKDGFIKPVKDGEATE